MNYYQAMIALISICTFPNPALHIDDQSVRKELEASINKYSEAYRKKDIKAIGDLLDPKFVSIQAGTAPIDRQKALSGYKKEMDAFAAEPEDQNIVEKVQVMGDKAVTEGKGRRILHLRDRLGKVHTVDMSGKSRLSWIKMNEKWRIKKAESWDVVIIIDGKPQNQNAKTGVEGTVKHPAKAK
jgi:ketosteroid isomerase-like protein